MTEIEKVVKNRRTNLRKNGYADDKFSEYPAPEPVGCDPG
jgi:hypothetical protein